MIKRLLKNEIFERAVKTFFEGFLASFGYFLCNNTSLDKITLKSALIGAIATGLSALINYLLPYLREEDKNVQRTKSK